MFDRWNDGTYFRRKLLPTHYDCDVQGNAYMHYLTGAYSEIAGDRGTELGENHAFFLERGQTILITRLSMRIHRLPVIGETTIWTTWYRCVVGKFFLRDFNAHTEDGELLISGSGSWALIGLEEKCAIDQSKYAGTRAPECHDKPDCQECKKIVPEYELPVIGTRPVYYTDLDCNNHMTNSAHTRIAVDFLPEEYRNKQPKDFFINFNRETKLGETLELRGGKTEKGYIVSGYCDGVLHFSTQFEY